MEEQMQTNQETNSSQSTVIMTVVGALILAIVGFGYLYSSQNPAMKNQDAQVQEQPIQNNQANDAVEKNTQDEALPTGENAEASNAETSEAETAEVKTINMEAGAFYYLPAEIKVKKGEKVKIVFTSKDMMHDFNVDELNIKSPIVKSGQTAEFEFTADKVGTFEYYCSVGQHKAQGQIGKLIVE